MSQFIIILGLRNDEYFEIKITCIYEEVLKFNCELLCVTLIINRRNIEYIRKMIHAFNALRCWGEYILSKFHMVIGSVVPLAFLDLPNKWNPLNLNNDYLI